MSETRHIRKVVKRRATIEGAGVHLHRVIGFGDPQLHDPFLSLDDFRSEEPVRFLFISGRPLREPFAWRGPIVMNTQQEQRVAFEELQRGTFIKAKGGAR